MPDDRRRIAGSSCGVTRQFDAVRDFNAEVDMVPALGTAEKSKITEYKDVRAYILFRRPADIRLIGLYPVVRAKAFDMVSDGVNEDIVRSTLTIPIGTPTTSMIESTAIGRFRQLFSPSPEMNGKRTRNSNPSAGPISKIGVSADGGKYERSA